MNKVPSKDEDRLIGKWIFKNGRMTADSVCKRIEWLINSYFEEIAVDGENCTTLYRNPGDGSYWERSYPQGEMHGCGPPALQRITEAEAAKRYEFDNSR